MSCRRQVFVSLFIVLSAFVSFNEAGTCRHVKSKVCENFSRFAVFPNSLGHRDEETAVKHINYWYPLTQIKCSNYLQQFLCIIYLPPCKEPGPATIVQPCWELCQLSKIDCFKTRLSRIPQKYEWPKSFKCDRFPSKLISSRTCFYRKDRTTTPMPRSSSTSMPTTTSTISNLFTTPEPLTPTCSAFQEKTVLNGLIRQLNSFRVPSACRRDIRERLLVGASSGDAQRRLGRIDRMLVGMKRSLRRLTLERKAALVVANIRRALQNL